jgi:hypothetical protein
VALTQLVAVPARRRLPILIPAEYWHLLSLDAPCVAAVWAWSIARALRITLPASQLLILFLGTWLLYVADRILDGLHPENSFRLRDRHFFYLRHRSAIFTAALPVAILLTWLVLLHMQARARRADALLFVVVAVYFALVHQRGRAIERWFPKELLVAVIAAAAIAAPAWSRLAPSDVEAAVALVFLAALFASLCWLNCVAIDKWERPLERQVRALTHVTNRTTKWGQQNLRLAGTLIAIAAAAAGGVLFGITQIVAAELCLAGSASAFLLAALDRAYPESRISAFHFRIAADAALLTPVLLIALR